MPILVSYSETYRTLFSKREKSKIDSFIDFCISKLLHKQSKSSIKYYINFDFHKKMKTCGETEVDSDVTDKGKYKEFSLYIKKSKDFDDMLQTIAHELVHVKQYMNGTMNFGKDLNHTIWNKKIFNEKKISYWELPWEIEAYGLEKCLYEMWIEKIVHKRKTKH